MASLSNNNYELSRIFSPETSLSLEEDQKLGESSQSSESQKINTAHHPLDELRHLLVKNGLIDRHAEPTPKLDKIPIPELDEEILRKINEFNTHERNIHFIDAFNYEYNIKFNLAELFQYLQHVTKHGKSLEITGGAVFWLLGQNYFERLLEKIGISDKSMLGEFFEKIKAKPNDQDLRFNTHRDISIKKIEALRDHLIGYLTQKMSFYDTENEFIRAFTHIHGNAFHKLFHCYKPHYCTVSPKDLEKTEITLVANLPRNHLFSHDGLRIDISTLIHEQKHGPMLVSDFKTAWKPLLHRMFMIIDADDIETINYMGFPLYVSYLTRGRICLKREFEKELISSYLDISKEQGIAYTLRKNALKVYENHHNDKDPSNGNSLPIYLINLLQALNMHLDEDELTKIRKTFVDLIPETEHQGLIKALSKILANTEINTKLLLAILQILFLNASFGKQLNEQQSEIQIFLREHCEEHSLQVHIKTEQENVTLLLHFDLNNALKTVQEGYESLNNQSKKLFEALYQTIMPSTLVPDHEHPTLSILSTDGDRLNDFIQALADSLKVHKDRTPKWALDFLTVMDSVPHHILNMIPFLEFIHPIIIAIEDPLRRHYFLEICIRSISPEYPSETYLNKKNKIIEAVNSKPFNEIIFINEWPYFLAASNNLKLHKMGVHLLGLNDYIDWFPIYESLLSQESAYAFNVLKRILRNPKGPFEHKKKSLVMILKCVIQNHKMLSISDTLATEVLAFIKGNSKKVYSTSNNDFLSLVPSLIHHLISQKHHDQSLALLQGVGLENILVINKAQIQELWIDLFVSLTQSDPSKALTLWIEERKLREYKGLTKEETAKRLNGALLGLLKSTEPCEISLKILTCINQKLLSPEEVKIYRSVSEKVLNQRDDFLSIKIEDYSNNGKDLLKALIVRRQTLELTKELKSKQEITEKYLKTFKNLMQQDQSELQDYEIKECVFAMIDALLKPQKEEHQNVWRLNRLRVLMTDKKIGEMKFTLSDLPLKFLHSAIGSLNEAIAKEALLVIENKIEDIVNPNQEVYSQAQVVKFVDLSFQFFWNSPQRTFISNKIFDALSTYQEFLCIQFIQIERYDLVIRLLDLLIAKSKLKPSQKLFSCCICALNKNMAPNEPSEELQQHNSLLRLIIDSDELFRPQNFEYVYPLIKRLVQNTFVQGDYSKALFWINRYAKFKNEPTENRNEFLLEWSTMFLSKNQLTESLEILSKIDLTNNVLIGVSQTWIALLKHQDSSSQPNKVIEILEICPFKEFDPVSLNLIKDLVIEIIQQRISASTKNSHELSRTFNLMLLYEVLDAKLWDHIFQQIADMPDKPLKDKAWETMTGFINQRDIFANNHIERGDAYINALRCLQVSSPEQCYHILKSRQSMMSVPLHEIVPCDKYDLLFTTLAKGVLAMEGDISGATLVEFNKAKTDISKYYKGNTPIINDFDLYFIENFINKKNIYTYTQSIILLKNFIIDYTEENDIDGSHLKRLISLYYKSLKEFRSLKEFSFYTAQGTFPLLDSIRMILLGTSVCLFNKHCNKISLPTILETLSKDVQVVEIDLINSLFKAIQSNLDIYKEQFKDDLTVKNTIKLLKKLLETDNISTVLNSIKMLTENQLIDRERLSKTWGILIMQMLSRRFKNPDSKSAQRSAYFFSQTYPHIYGTEAELPTTTYFFQSIVKYLDFVNIDSDNLLIELFDQFHVTLLETFNKVGYEPAIKTVSRMQNRYSGSFDILNDALYLFPNKEYKIPKAVECEYLLQFLNVIVNNIGNNSCLSEIDSEAKNRNMINQGIAILKKISADYSFQVLAPENINLVFKFFDFAFPYYDKVSASSPESNREKLANGPKKLTDDIFFFLTNLTPYANYQAVSTYFLYFLKNMVEVEFKSTSFNIEIMEMTKLLIVSYIHTFKGQTCNDFKKIIFTYFAMQFPFNSDSLLKTHLENCDTLILVLKEVNSISNKDDLFAEIKTYKDPASLLKLKESKKYLCNINYIFNKLFRISTRTAIIQAIEILKIHGQYLYDNHKEKFFNLIENLAKKLTWESMYDRSGPLIFNLLLKPLSDEEKLLYMQKTPIFHNILLSMTQVKMGEKGLDSKERIEAFIRTVINTLLLGLQKKILAGKDTPIEPLLQTIQHASKYYLGTPDCDCHFIEQQFRILANIAKRTWGEDEAIQQRNTHHLEKFINSFQTLFLKQEANKS